MQNMISGCVCLVLCIIEKQTRQSTCMCLFILCSEAKNGGLFLLVNKVEVFIWFLLYFSDLLDLDKVLFYLIGSSCHLLPILFFIKTLITKTHLARHIQVRHEHVGDKHHKLDDKFSKACSFMVRNHRVSSKKWNTSTNRGEKKKENLLLTECIKPIVKDD